MNLRPISRSCVTAWLLLCLSLSSHLFAQTGSNRSLTIPSINWPKEARAGQTRLLLFQIQPDSIKGNQLFAKAAVRFEEPGLPLSATAISLQGTLHTDPTFGIYWLTDLQVTSLLKNISKSQVDEPIGRKITGFLSGWEVRSLICELAATLPEGSTSSQSHPPCRIAPPEILFRTRPSLLLSFEGIPRFSKKVMEDCLVADNSGAFVVKHLPNGLFYTLDNGSWYCTNQMPDGKWMRINAPPEKVSRCRATLQNRFGKEMGFQKALSEKDLFQAPADIIVVTVPTELLLFQGDPVYKPIGQSGLSHAVNTPCNLIRDDKQSRFFLLLSGRWLTSSAMTGPWRFIEMDQLPGNFSLIPDNGPMAHVRYAVAGTREARVSLAEANIPTTAIVDRKTTHAIVSFEGDPLFLKIPGSSLQRCLNSSKPLLKSQEEYLLCDHAVWFTGKDAKGPWSVATKLPSAIDSIPCSDPAYPLSFAKIYHVTGTTVSTGYLPGFFGSVREGSTIVYGYGNEQQRRVWVDGIAPFNSWGMGMTYFANSGWKSNKALTPDLIEGYEDNPGRVNYYCFYKEGVVSGAMAYLNSTPSEKQRITMEGLNGGECTSDSLQPGDSLQAPQTSKKDKKRMIPIQGTQNNMYAGVDGSLYIYQDGRWMVMDNKGIRVSEVTSDKNPNGPLTGLLGFLEQQRATRDYASRLASEFANFQRHSAIVNKTDEVSPPPGRK